MFLHVKSITRCILLIFACSSSVTYSFSIKHDSRSVNGNNLHVQPRAKINNGSNIKKSRNTCIRALAKTGGAEPSHISFQRKLVSFTSKNGFLLSMVLAVLSAKKFPSLGANGSILKPEIFFGKYGVTGIFLLSGLSVELSELKDAARNLKLNALIQSISFLAWPFLIGMPVVSTIKRLMPNLLPPALLDGILILTCLPTTVNMCVILTRSAGGNVSSALCNAVIGNMMGILATPALLMGFFGSTIQLPFIDIILKLCKKVLLPVTVGQILRAGGAKDFYIRNKKRFKVMQESILVGLVWNAFCNAFTKGLGVELKHAIFLLCLLPTLHLGSMFILFKLFSSKRLNFTKREVVAGIFCASHKTLAFGLPLVNTFFEGNPNLAAYCAPIMFIHPLQLILGSLLTGPLSDYTASEQEELS